MREFFRGWRRKAGCVTLVMACGLSAAWTRSYRIFEGYTFGMDERHATHVIDLSCGRIIWSRRELLRVFMMGDPHYQRGWHNLRSPSLTSAPPPVDFHSDEVEYDCWQCAGFDIGVAQKMIIVGRAFEDGFDGTVEKAIPFERVTYWAVPFWAVVLMPTLLSAYLILRKPRTKSNGQQDA